MLDPHNRTSYADLAQHFSRAHRFGLETIFLLNPACLGGREFQAGGIQEILEIARFLKSLEVDYLVPGNPFLVDVFRRLCPAVKIKISSHYNVDSMGKFDLFLVDLKADVVTVSQFANKNFSLLRQAARKYGPERLEILCTVPCMPGCPYRFWHATSVAHSGEHDPFLAGFASREQPCMCETVLNPYLLMCGAFVRREDLCYYQELGINRFKICERMHPMEINLACARYYTHSGSVPKELLI